MSTYKNIPLWVKILVWTPLGLYLYPKYFWGIGDEKLPDLYPLINGIMMGIYIVIIIHSIFNFFFNF